MDRRTFTAVIEAGRGGGAFVTVPFDVKAAFGSARPKVKATLDGAPYRGSIAPMGGCHVLGVTRALREATGKSVGDTLRVVVEADEAPREVTVPDDLKRALRGKKGATAFLDGLAFTYRKEYVRWIEGAKRGETRERRVAQAVEKLTRGEKL